MFHKYLKYASKLDSLIQTGSASWECVNRQSDYGYRCKNRSENYFYPYQKDCESECRDNIIVNGEIMHVNYPIPADFLISLQHSSDFQDFIHNKNRFNMIPKYISIYLTINPLSNKLPGEFNIYHLIKDTNIKQKIFQIPDNIYLISDNLQVLISTTVDPIKYGIFLKKILDSKNLSIIDQIIGTNGQNLIIIQDNTLDKYPINNYYVREMIRLKLNDHKIKTIICPITILNFSFSDDFVHGCMMVIDKKDNQTINIFYFDPHTHQTYYSLEKFKSVLKLYFTDNYHINPNVESFDICPKNIILQEHDGLCQSWTLFAIIMHIYNPLIPWHLLYEKISSRHYKSYLIKFLYYLEYGLKINFPLVFEYLESLDNVDYKQPLHQLNNIFYLQNI